MSRHLFSCRDITLRFCKLHCSLLMSRPQSSCCDISSRYCNLERLSPVVVTLLMASKPSVDLLLVSRHQSSCRDITLCCCRLHWLLMMSRLQLFCRNITLLISAPTSAAYAVIPVATCIKFPLIFLMSRPQN